MKRFATSLLALVCLAAGGARWLDLVNCTDLATGFSTYGSYWVRYAVVGAVLGTSTTTTFAESAAGIDSEACARPVSASTASTFARRSSAGRCLTATSTFLLTLIQGNSLCS